MSDFSCIKNHPSFDKPPNNSAINPLGNPKHLLGWNSSRMVPQPKTHQAARRWCKHQCTDSPAPEYEENAKRLVIRLWQQLLPCCLKGSIFFRESSSVQNIILNNQCKLLVTMVWVLLVQIKPIEQDLKSL